MTSEVPLLALSPKVAPPNTNEEPIETSEVKAVETSSKASPRTSIGKEEGKYTRPQVADGENFVRYVDETAQSSMLISAAANNQLSLMKELFALGVTPNSTDYDKRSALHVACAEGHEESTRLLLEHGANLNVRDRFGLTPLDEAIKSRNPVLVGELLEKGAEVSKSSSESSLIATASQTGEEALRMAELILKAKVDPNCVDSDGRTPLHFAAAEANAPMVELLLKNGADPQIEDRWKSTRR